MLEVRNVSKAYGSEGDLNYQRVLKKINFILHPGETMAITGPSGCGKSTLLNIIGTLDIASAGELFFDGVDMVSFTRRQAEIFRNTQLGFVFQMHHLLPQCTLMQNVLLPTLGSRNKAVTLARAVQYIKDLGLWDRRNDKPSTLSGGECQRAALIRALINEPRMILADEPTGALDENNAALLMDLLLDLNKKNGTALIVVSHTKEIANKMDRVFRLSGGELHQLK